MRLATTCLLLAWAAGAAAQVDVIGKDGRVKANESYRGDNEEPWRELEVEPPAYPKQDALIEFYAGAAAANRYFIDPGTLDVGGDGVVRYVLVIKTEGGATNVSFEGINCKTLSWKHYASGRGDGTWARSLAVRADWRPIASKTLNRQHAALSRDLFCPAGVAIKTADEGRAALRAGKHPNSN